MKPRMRADQRGLKTIGVHPRSSAVPFIVLTLAFFLVIAFFYLKKSGPLLAPPTNDAYTHYNLALGYAEQNRFVQAKAEYEQALQLKPDFVEARLNLGLLYHRNNLLDDAIKSYGDIIRINPGYALAHYN